MAKAKLTLEEAARVAAQAIRANVSEADAYASTIGRGYGTLSAKRVVAAMRKAGA